MFSPSCIHNKILAPFLEKERRMRVWVVLPMMHVGGKVSGGEDTTAEHCIHDAGIPHWEGGIGEVMIPVMIPR